MRQHFIARTAIALAVATTSLGALAATEAQKQAAIAGGLGYLAAQQQANGRWIYDGGTGDVAATGAALLAFIEEGHTPTSGTAYSAVVANGMNWIWQNAVQQKALNAQPHGNPDSNGNGIGYKFNTVAGSSTYDMYNTGSVLPALAKAGPAATVINSPGSVVHGKTYGQVIQDVADYIGWGQTDSGWGRGGWRYGENTGDADNSVSQWPALGLLYAQGAGATVPQFVKDEMKFWLQYSQNDVTGGAGYTDPNGTTALRTGSWLVQAKASGTLTAAEVNAAIAYVNTHWSNDGSNFNEIYGMWAIYKGLESWIGTGNTGVITNLRPGNCGGNVDNPDHGCNWWEDMNERLFATQLANGSWNLGSFGTSVMKTAWAVNILQAVQIPDNGVPVPGTLALVALGLGGLALRPRRRVAA